MWLDSNAEYKGFVHYGRIDISVHWFSEIIQGYIIFFTMLPLLYLGGKHWRRNPSMRSFIWRQIHYHTKQMVRYVWNCGIGFCHIAD